MSKKIQLAGCLFILLLARVGFGCSMIVRPITHFDSEEYVFTGKVIGLVGPQKLKDVAGESWGVSVEATESVHSPKVPASYFEVLPFDLRPDCTSQGRSKERISKDFPIGSNVVVIAKESKFDLPNSGNVKLVIVPATNGLLSTIGVQDEPFLAKSVYDYRAYKETQKNLPMFELRKDLLRLRQASSEEEKEKVMRRLVYFPRTLWMDYKKIVELHVKDNDMATKLIAEREAWTRRSTR